MLNKFDVLWITLSVTGLYASDMDCVREMELPSYSFVARRNPRGGTVTAVVTVGEHGTAKSVGTGDADKNLAEEVRDSLTDGTKYVESCVGKELRLVFTFRLEGQPVPIPPTTIHFEPPNHFILISKPRAPYIDAVPQRK